MADDLAVPAETRIYYSRTKYLADFILSCLLLALGLFLLYSSSGLWGYAGAILFVLFAGFMCYLHGRNLLNTTPQIILSNQGIQTSKTPFYEWYKITDQQVLFRKSGRYTSSYLTYNYIGGSEEFYLDRLSVSSRELEYLLEVYSGRNPY